MQFLRRTLLAGAFKFDQKATQTLPLRIFDQFKNDIGRLSRLICVGYSFGDYHINQVILKWLENRADTALDIIGPGVEKVPGPFLHMLPQINLVNSTATEYFDMVGGITPSRRELLERRLSAWIRKSSSKEEARVEFRKFVENYIQNCSLGAC